MRKRVYNFVSGCLGDNDDESIEDGNNIMKRGEIDHDDSDDNVDNDY